MRHKGYCGIFMDIQSVKFEEDGQRPPIAGYDEEASFFEAGVKATKRTELLEALLQEFEPAFKGQLSLLSNACLARAKSAIASLDESPDRYADLALQYVPWHPMFNPTKALQDF